MYLTIALYGCYNQTSNKVFAQGLIDVDNCLTNNSFDLVKNYISKNGIQIKLYKAGIITDTTILSKQIFLNDHTIALVDYQNYNHIIVINKFDEDKIPIYFVSNKNTPCQISAYYSVLDTDKSIIIRKDDWCNIVMNVIKIKQNIVFIDKKSALKIAQKDAQTAYRDLSIYTIKAVFKEYKWYVDYDLSNQQMVGGGPHYIICGISGNILTRRYEQ